MNGRQNQWSFIDTLTLLDTALQIADYQMNVEQTDNNTIMAELQKQTEQYLKKIIDNQQSIMESLSDLKDTRQ